MTWQTIIGADIVPQRRGLPGRSRSIRSLSATREASRDNVSLNVRSTPLPPGRMNVMPTLQNVTYGLHQSQPANRADLSSNTGVPSPSASSRCSWVAASPTTSHTISPPRCRAASSRTRSIVMSRTVRSCRRT